MTGDYEVYTNDPDWEYPDEMDTPDEPTITKKIGTPNASIKPGSMTQHMILSYLLHDMQLWRKCSTILGEQHFDKEYRPLVNFLQTFTAKYNRMPSTLTVQAETGIELDTPSDITDPRIQDYVCNRVEDYVRFKSLQDMLWKAADTLDSNPTVDTAGMILSQIQNITKISLHRDLGFEVHRDARELLQRAEEADGRSTGLHLLDMCFDGGVTLPSLNLVSAYTGNGKSIWLQNMAVNMAEQGHNVVFYTLELEAETLQKRFAAMMTNTATKLIYNNLESVLHTMETRSRKEGKIQVKKFSMGTTMAEIAAHYNDLVAETGEVWDRVIIDYIDVMKPVQRGIAMDNIHLKEKAIIEEINDFAHEPNLPKIVWTASQQTKGSDKEKEGTLSNISGSAGKPNTCDNVVILKRSKEDRIAELIWGFIDKARSSAGKGMWVPIHWNPNTLRMLDGPEDLFYEANPFILGKKDIEPTKAKDPIARERGVNINATPKKVEKAGREKTGEERRQALLSKFAPDRTGA